MHKDQDGSPATLNVFKITNESNFIAKSFKCL